MNQKTSMQLSFWDKFFFIGKESSINRWQFIMRLLVVVWLFALAVAWLQVLKYFWIFQWETWIKTIFLLVFSLPAMYIFAIIAIKRIMNIAPNEYLFKIVGGILVFFMVLDFWLKWVSHFFDGVNTDQIFGITLIGAYIFTLIGLCVFPSYSFHKTQTQK